MDWSAQGKKTLALVAAGLVLAAGLFWGLLFAVRALQRSRTLHNQSTAIETLRVLNNALRAYHEKYEGYPDSLERLRGGEEGNPVTAPPERARLLDTRLAQDSFEKSGYKFFYERGQRQQRWAATVPLYSSYRLTAAPSSPSREKLFFYTDQSGQLRQRRGQAASADDPPVQ